MKILIIGGTGILSAAVVNRSLNKGYEVTMINRGNNPKFIDPRAKLIKCDVNDESKVREKLSDSHFDVVIDFIVSMPSQLERSLSLFGKIATQYIYISSAQIYNTSISKKFEETDDTPQPLWKYSVNKDLCEKYLREQAKKRNINFTIIRPGVNYDNRRIPYGIVPAYGWHWTIVARIMAGKPIITWNNGSNKLNITRVEDFADGLIGLLGNVKAYNECFNIVGDNVYTWKDVLDTLGKILGKPVIMVDIPLKEYAANLNPDNQERLLGGRACDLVCSNNKLKSVVPSFKTNIPLYDGLKMTIDGYKANNYYKGIDYRWDAEQDRILHTVLKRYWGHYVSYQYENTKEKWTNMFVYKFEYYKNRSFMTILWKCIRKFIYKPLVMIIK